MSDSLNFEIENAAAAAKEAIAFEYKEDAARAKVKYVEAADWLLLLLKRETDEKRKTGLTKRLEEYLGRAEAMQKLASLPRRPPKKVEEDARSRVSTADHYFSADELFRRDVARAREVIQKLEDRNVLFTDTEFRGEAALGGRRRSDVAWRRASEFADKLFDEKEGPRPRDVDQGSLGDCWLLSSVTVLAGFPELVRRLVVAESSKLGAYVARLCYGGEWRLVLVDDLLPCRQGPLFARPCQGTCWCAILEKACAKLFGSYEALDQGTAAEALALLTGLPTKPIEKIHKDASSLFETMQQAYEAGSIVSASCGHADVAESEYALVGLRHAHEYAVLRVVELDDVRLVELRNPWASGEWQGKWSRGSQEWRTSKGRQVLQAILGQEATVEEELASFAKDDGVFWMALEDLRVYFHEVTICRLRRNFAQHRVPCVVVNEKKARTLASPFRAFAFDVAPGKGTVQLDACLVQATERGKVPKGHHVIADAVLCVYRLRTKTLDAASLARATLVAASEPGNLVAIVAADFVELPPGAYLAVPFYFNWRVLNLSAAPLTAVFYSSAPLQDVAPVELDVPAAAAALRVAVKTRGQWRNAPTDNQQASPAKLTAWEGIHLAENTSRTARVTVTFRLGRCEHLVSSRHGGVVDPNRDAGAYVVQDTLPPSTFQVTSIMSPFRSSWSVENSQRSWIFNDPQNPVAPAHHPPLAGLGPRTLHSLHSVFPLPTTPPEGTVVGPPPSSSQ